MICGAGIAGIATAYYLAETQGITDVILVDKRAPLTLTSDKSGECYRNWWPDPFLAQLMNRSIDLINPATSTTNATGDHTAQGKIRTRSASGQLRKKSCRLLQSPIRDKDFL